MYFSLPTLPFEPTSISTFLSSETLDYHHGKHHRSYVAKLNALLVSSGMEKASLKEIIMRANGPLLDNAAQVWNHAFYWHCITNSKENKQEHLIKRYHALDLAICNHFGSIEKFERQFIMEASDLFGSGWLWLVVNGNTGKLEIFRTQNADNPLRSGHLPLLTCDLWEHAYYIDYRNARTKYVEGFLRTINWSFVNRNLANNESFDLYGEKKPLPSEK